MTFQTIFGWFLDNFWMFFWTIFGYFFGQFFGNSGHFEHWDYSNSASFRIKVALILFDLGTLSTVWNKYHYTYRFLFYFSFPFFFWKMTETLKLSTLISLINKETLLLILDSFFQEKFLVLAYWFLKFCSTLLVYSCLHVYYMI